MGELVGDCVSFGGLCPLPRQRAPPKERQAQSTNQQWSKKDGRESEMESTNGKPIDEMNEFI